MTTDSTTTPAEVGSPVLSEGLGGSAEALRRDHGGSAARRKFIDLPATHRVVGWESLGGDGVRYSFASFQRDLFNEAAVWGPVTHLTTVTHAEIRAEFDRVESEAGECGACVRGVGWRGWNHVTGHRFAACERCGGSALPPND